MALWRSPALLLGLVGTEVALRVVAGFGAFPTFGGITSSWCWVILSVVALFVFANVAEIRQGRRLQAEATVEEFADVPLEWVGITTSFTSDHVRALDRELVLGEAASHVAH
jgi:hypothetical protein